MIKIIDPTQTKVITVSGTDVTIQPLTPNQRRKAYLTWGIVNEKQNKTSGEEVVNHTLKNVDRDELAALIAPGVKKIDIEKVDGHEDREIYDLLVWMEDKDFWEIAFQVMPYTGMNEEEVKNSPSLSEQDAQASPASVAKPVKTKKGPVSATKKK